MHTTGLQPNPLGAGVDTNKKNDVQFKTNKQNTYLQIKLLFFLGLFTTLNAFYANELLCRSIKVGREKLRRIETTEIRRNR